MEHARIEVAAADTVWPGSMPNRLERRHRATKQPSLRKTLLAAQGHVKDDMFVVVDAFALPVEGTETRVNAQAEAYEYMVDFAETNKVCYCAFSFPVRRFLCMVESQSCASWRTLAYANRHPSSRTPHMLAKDA